MRCSHDGGAIIGDGERTEAGARGMPARPTSVGHSWRLARLSLRHTVCLVIAVGIFGAPILYVALQAFKTEAEFTFNKVGLPSWPLAFSTFRAAWGPGRLRPRTYKQHGLLALSRF